MMIIVIIILVNDDYACRVYERNHFAAQVNGYLNDRRQYLIAGGGCDPSRDQSIASDTSSYRVPAWVPDHRYKNCMICQK